jgi:ferredoxin
LTNSFSFSSGKRNQEKCFSSGTTLILRMATVTIKREDCTSCTTCWSTCPEVFEEDPADGMSRIKEAFRISGDLGMGEVPDEHYNCVQEAAVACPVEIINVED